MYQRSNQRTRKQHSPTGVPMVRTSFAHPDEPPAEAQKSPRAWWAWLRLTALAGLSAAALAGCTEARADEGQIVGHIHRHTERSRAQYATSCKKSCDAADRCETGTQYCYKFSCPDDGDWVYGSCGGCQ